MFSARTGTRHNILVMGRACFLRVPVSEANDLNYLLCAARSWIKAPLLWPTVIASYYWAENNTPEITTAAPYAWELNLQAGWPERGADDINQLPLPPCSNAHRNMAAHNFVSAAAK